jgi:hypothetical protein
MKSTDIARRDREIRRNQKKAEVIQRKQGKRDGFTVGDYIKLLSEKFFHDAEKIYNIKSNNEEILLLIEEIKENIDEKNWDTILRKAVKNTGIKKKEEAFKELKEFFSS